VVSPARAADSRLMVIGPRLGTGWEITVNDLTREVRLQFKLLGLALPIGRKIPFLDVVHIGVVCKSLWSCAVGFAYGGLWRNSGMFGVGSDREPTPMPTIGWRYDVLMTQKGGRAIRIERLKSSQAADELAGKLRQRLGLSAPDGSTKR
jgi:hypothetical protein